MVCSCGSITFQLTSLHHRLPQLHQWLYKGPRVADCSESWENWRSHRKCELQKFNNHKCGSTTICACSQAKNKLGTTSAADLVSHTSLQAQLDHHFLQLHSSDRRKSRDFLFEGTRHLPQTLLALLAVLNRSGLLKHMVVTVKDKWTIQW